MHRIRQPALWLVPIAAFIGALLLITQPTRAATISVADGAVRINFDDQCSLLEAVQNATTDSQVHPDCPAGSGADMIELAANGTYIEDFTTNIITIPADTNLLTINGNGATFDNLSIEVTGSLNLTINDLTLTGITGRNAIRIDDGDVTLDSLVMQENAGAYAVRNAATLTLLNSSISDNNLGGVLNAGILNVQGSVISGNTATTGGGIYNDGGTVTLSAASSVRENSAIDSGGGIYNLAGTINIEASAVNRNQAIGGYGGGLINVGNGLVRLSSASQMTGNRALIDGGGIYNFQGRVESSTRTLLDGNTAFRGGAIFNSASGSLNLTSTTITNNSASGTAPMAPVIFEGNSERGGGGLLSYGPMTLSSSTIQNNYAEGRGGGIFNAGSTQMFNLAIADNSAGALGAGVYTAASGTIQLSYSNLTGNIGTAIHAATGTLNLSHIALANNSAGLANLGATTLLETSTISGNNGDGLLNSASGSLTLSSVTLTENSTGLNSLTGTVRVGNSIIIGNFDANCSGGYTSDGYNLFGTDCPPDGTSDLTLTDDPSAVIAPLTTSGPLVHPLVLGSPAIDNGFCPEGVDQRGLPRPVDVLLRTNPPGNTCDIGAFELQEPLNAPPVARADTYATNFQTPVLISAANGVLQNDSDPDGDPLIALLVSNPANGTLILGGDGGFTYFPNTGFSGTDSFTYQASDSLARSEVTEVTINVGAPVPTETPPPEATEEPVPVTPVPDELVLLAPLGLQSESDGSPVYVWTDRPGATGYGIYVHRTGDINDRVLYEVVSDSSYCDGVICQLDATTLSNAYWLPNGGYSVWLLSSTEPDKWKGPFEFTINATRPALANPLAVTETKLLNPVYTWELPAGDARNASWFRIYVAPTGDLAATALDFWVARRDACSGEDGITCALRLPEGLDGNVDYSLYMRSWGPGGLSDGWAGPLDFRLGLRPVREMQTEVDGERVTFTWRASEGATWYQVWVGTLNPLQTQDVLTWQPADQFGCAAGGVCTITRTLPAGTYEWYVQGWGPTSGSIVGSLSEWAAGPSFTVNP